MTVKLFKASAPLHRVITEAGQWRWYQPDTGYSAPTEDLVDRIINHFHGEAKSLDSFAVDDESREVVEITLSRLISAGFLTDDSQTNPNHFPEKAPTGPVELAAFSPTLFNAPRLEQEPAADAIVLGVGYAGRLS